MKTILVSTQVLSKSAKNVAEGTSYRSDAIDPGTDVRAQALGFSRVNFSWALGFGR